MKYQNIFKDKGIIHIVANLLYATIILKKIKSYKRRYVKFKLGNL